MEENNNIVEENEEIVEEAERAVEETEEVVEESTETVESENSAEEKESTEDEKSVDEGDKEVDSKSSKIIFRIVIVMIILLILVLIGVLIYFNKSNKIKDDNDTPKKETKEVVDVNNTIELSNEWKDYVIGVYNKTLKLPTTYERVEALSGFKYDSGDSKSYMKAHSNDIINLYVEDKLALYVYVKNDKDEEIEYTDSKVIGIWQSKYEVEKNYAEPIVFPGNLIVGQEMNRETLVSLFGEPSNVRSTNLENYVTDDYYYYEDEKDVTEKYYRITVVNGKITDIYLLNEK